MYVFSNHRKFTRIARGGSPAEGECSSADFTGKIRQFLPSQRVYFRKIDVFLMLFEHFFHFRYVTESCRPTLF